MTATDTTDKDRLLHLMFRLLPSQKRYPEYYKTIEKPLDLKMIATKIVENKYTSTNELEVCTIMSIPVMEFWREGYKIRKVLG